MTIAQALKEKNKIVASIQKNWDKINRYNSQIVGSEKPYDLAQVFSKIGEETAQLIKLKTDIHIASAPVRDLIFSLSEYKSMAQKIKSVNVSSGPVSERFSNTVNQMEAQLSVIWQENEISAIESKIDAIQEKLDSFNYTTEI